MKNKIYLLCLLFIVCFLNIKAQNWAWALSLITGGNDYSNNAATDSDGNVYIVGQTNSYHFYITFMSWDLMQIGNKDIFIIKYSPSGKAIWAKRVGGINATASGDRIAVDKNNNVYIAGSITEGTINFDTTKLSNNGVKTLFIAKYDSSGKVLWAKSANGTISVTGLKTDIKGDVYLTGNFRDTAANFGSSTLALQGISDVYIVKYDPNGNIIWLKGAGGIYADYAVAIATDKWGNIYISGEFQSPSITFSSKTIINVDTTTTHYNEIFIVKYDTTGNVIWLKGVGKFHESLYGTGIATDSVGNFFLTGGFSGKITLDSISLTAAIGGQAIFLTKFDNNGNIFWAKMVAGHGGSGNQVTPNSITVDPLDNIYTTGYFWTDTLYCGNTKLLRQGACDIFVVKFDANGNVNWAASAGRESYDYGTCLTSDTSGNIYVTGYYQSSGICFGSFCFGNTGTTNFFLAKLSPAIVGINDFFVNENSLIIYPNPLTSSSILQLNTQLIPNESGAEVVIYDVLGKEMLRRKMDGDRMEIERGSLVSGVYFVRVRSEERDWTQKLIIE